MSIENSFDRNGIEVISPSQIAEKIDNFPETVVSVFSDKFLDLALRTTDAEQISTMFAGRAIPVYKVKYKDSYIGLYNSVIGGAAAGLLEEIFAKGAKRVLYFGSCGVLNKEVTVGHIIIPSAAYRDEGVSYHYMDASDYVEVKSADRLARVLDSLNVPYIKTFTWTTDCFYRETLSNMNKRKSEGCAVVEMECASLMAVGQFRNKEVYEFLYAADCLDSDNWDRRILGNMPDDMRERLLKIAFETAIRLN